MPELQHIAETYTDELIVPGINQRESVDPVQGYVQEIGVTFPILINPPDDVLLPLFDSLRQQLNRKKSKNKR